MLLIEIFSSFFGYSRDLFFTLIDTQIKVDQYCGIVPFDEYYDIYNFFLE
jgi:hypothetical protein